MLPDDVLPFSMFIASYVVFVYAIKTYQCNEIKFSLKDIHTRKTTTIHCYIVQLIQLKNIKLKAFCIQHSLKQI